MTTTASSIAMDFAPPEVLVERRPCGTMVFRSPWELTPFASTVGSLLDEAAADSPRATFLAERSGNGWREVSYAETRNQVRRIASSLLMLKGFSERPLAILSDNSIDVGLITLAAMYVGIPVVPVSSAYSKVSQTFEKLRAIVGATNPAVIFASDAQTYGRAIRAVASTDTQIIVGDPTGGDPGWTEFAQFMAAPVDDGLVDAAAAKVNAKSLAKIMFTSGSTGQPKGVMMTHAMILAHQQGITQTWLFLNTQPPVILDWLPWSHSFGGNHNFVMVLRHKGSLYIDDGRPLPALIERTVANLRTVSPTMVLSVPRAYGMLLPYLEADSGLARSFFRNLKLLFYAAADMPASDWRRLEELAARHADQPPYFVSSWGMSENIAAATIVHFPTKRAGSIGLPVPGTTIKLSPTDDKLELRIRGPAVTPGYWGRPDLTKAAFDEEGFYRSGDAGRLVDPENPVAGFAYDGRISENFKLSTGSWVFAGGLRVRAIAAGAPIVEDVVIAAPDRDEVALLVFPSLMGCRTVAPGHDDAGLDELVALPEIRACIKAMLRKLAEDHEGANRIRRAIILTEPPSLDGHEITDKGSINQRAVLARRAAIVDRLYQQQSADVITPD